MIAPARIIPRRGIDETSLPAGKAGAMEHYFNPASRVIQRSAPRRGAQAAARGMILAEQSIALFIIFIFLLFPKSLFAAIDPPSYIVTIESVELKNAEGQWITVVTPDHPVDVVAQEPGFSFFNNGKVPIGPYVNFRIKVEKKSSREKIEITSAKDFEESLVVSRGSYIGAWFKLSFSPDKVEGATVTVDEKTKEFGSDAVEVAYD